MARTPAKRSTIAFIASNADEAQAAQARLAAALSAASRRRRPSVIVALGGDGFMLQTLHAFMNTGKPIYGMNCGSVGFLMNEFREDGLARTPRRGGRPPPSTRSPCAPSTPCGTTPRRLRHQRGVAAPPVLPGGEAAHLDRRPGPHGGADLRRHPGRDAGRQHRLQSLRPRADPADLRAAPRAHPDQRLPPAHLARRAPPRPRRGAGSRRSRPRSGRSTSSPTMSSSSRWSR